MSGRRLLGTALGMAAIAVALTALAAPLPETATALARPQATADSAGSDVLVLHVAGLLAWLVWAWGSLGLVLTAATALPGLSGAVARGVLHRVLPAGARRVAALTLGIGLTLGPPVPGTAATVVTTAPASASTAAETGPPSSGTATPASAVPDWPAPAAPPATGHGAVGAGPERSGLPDWPRAPAGGEHVVVRGDCLWEIAERRLAAATGRPPTPAEVAGAVDAWWRANADVIGPDPDLLLPGQVLRPPAGP